MQTVLERIQILRLNKVEGQSESPSQSDTCAPTPEMETDSESSSGQYESEAQPIESPGPEDGLTSQD